MRIVRAKRLRGEITVPGDKSISHRAVMIGSLAEGTTLVCGFLPGEDCLSTVHCFRQMGVEIKELTSSQLQIQGRGLFGLREPDNVLDAGNSGTTMRLMLGILAGQSFFSVITGDASLRNRPMDRVVLPLTTMGADIRGRKGNTLAPLCVLGKGKIKAMELPSPVASAQVKSAILLAGLFAQGKTTVIEPVQSRDHTERMLACFGADIQRANTGNSVSVTGLPSLQGRTVSIPGDISSAAFFMVAGSLVPGSEIIIKNVGTNPTRSGIIYALKDMGADISLLNERQECGEPVADILVRHAPLHGIDISGSIIPTLIDEIPALAVAATQARGTTVIRDVRELRFKETDRIKTIASELTRLGARIKEEGDSLVIEGPIPLQGNPCSSHGDHRIAMALAVAGLVAEGETQISGSESVAISFPGFMNKLDEILEEPY